ncbi:hypothetical protein NFI96_001974 [Prochilodus magdalenae]|nr:hypothetical protein NFI96_001974 [Prochilodus magdalenae]
MYQEPRYPGAQQSSSLFRPCWEESKSLMALGTKDLLSLSVEQLCDSSLPLNLLLLSMMMVCSGCPSSSIMDSSLCSVLLSATFTTESSSTPTTDPARLTSLYGRNVVNSLLSHIQKAWCHSTSTFSTAILHYRNASTDKEYYRPKAKASMVARFLDILPLVGYQVRTLTEPPQGTSVSPL